MTDFYWRKHRTSRIILLSILLLLYGFIIHEQSKVNLPIPSPQVSIKLPIPEPQVELKDSIRISRVSAYNPVPRQTDADPEVSSCGPTLERQIAVSQDLFFNERGEKYLCGTTVTVVTDAGHIFRDYVINDTMNPRYRNTVDVMLPHTDESQAFAFGVQVGHLIFN